MTHSLYRPRNVALVLALWLSAADSAPAWNGPEAMRPNVAFRSHRIGSFRSEACCAADFNRDGKIDVAAGPFLYLAPDWKPVKIREVQGEVDAKGIGYYWDFANIAYDVDGDGWTDIVACSWFGRKAMWFRNPGPKGGFWAEHSIETGRLFETADAADLLGGANRPVILPVVEQTVWYEAGRLPDGAPGFLVHVISDKKFPHGVGAGDLNGDGRCDVLRTGAWFEAPAAPRGGRWVEHPLSLGGKDGKTDHSANIIVYDVNGDGLNDIITSSAHRHGIFWYEQTREGTEIGWRQHVIDDTWSQAHALAWADLDGDGKPELVAGKRFMAHNGSDPDESGPLGVYYYAFDRGPNPAWSKHVISRGEGFGVGLNAVIVDLNGDGRPDILTTGKFGGPVWFENVVEAVENRAAR